MHDLKKWKEKAQKQHWSEEADRVTRSLNRDQRSNDFHLYLRHLCAFDGHSDQIHAVKEAIGRRNVRSYDHAPHLFTGF